MKPELYLLTWSDLLVSLVFIALCIVIVRWWKLGLEKTLLIGTLRTFAQLTIMGYALTFIFNQRHWGFMTALLILMLIVASFEARRRQKTHIPHFLRAVMIALSVTTVVILGTIMQFILDVKPWYNPYAAIPIAGMILGNGMNSVSLTANRFIAELRHREGEIETLLALGATPRQAIQDTLRESIQAALIPNLNALMTVGLVQLPGMMTGQILAGVDPVIAVRYQIMIMYMWVTTAALANVLTMALISREYFTARLQLRRALIR
jgi:putative ABC transport system permease protein